MPVSKSSGVAQFVAENWLQALKSENPADRWRAATRLIDAARSQQTEALAALADALGDDHPFVRWRAGWALALAHRPRAMATLLDELEGATPRRQAAAADALAYARGANPESLLRALSSQDALVRQSAAEVLGQLAYRQTVLRFITLLTDESPWVRRAAVRALGHIGDSHSTGLLCQRLADESPLVRRSAAYALGAMRDRDTMPALVMTLDDPDPQVRRNAAWGLGRIGNPAALPKLRALRSDTALDGDVAREAEAAIQAIERPGWQRLPGAVWSWFARRIASARWR